MNLRFALVASVAMVIACTEPATPPDSLYGPDDNRECPMQRSFGSEDSVEVVSQAHRGILVTWQAPDTVPGVAWYQVYRSIATTRDTCDQIHVDTADGHFLSVRERAFIAPGDTAYEDVIDLMDAVYWYGVTATLSDSSTLWLGYDSATVRNVYEYNPYVETSSLVMQNVRLLDGTWAAAGFPYDSAGFPYYLLDFAAGPYDGFIRQAQCSRFGADGHCESLETAPAWGHVSHSTSGERDTLYVRSVDETDSIAYRMEYMADGALMLSRITADSLVVDTSLAALIDSLPPLYKGPAEP
ncbi:MAG: hypothetical protein GF331_13930 [Chitinivibrionales bacterium]|nr:hypothetical protein [Chitinivibrionales bacterium]